MPTPPLLQNSQDRLRAQRAHRGFSLIEVTLALGIVSFALITILGVMPVGLNTLRDAVDETTETQIVRQLGAEASLLPFTDIKATMDGKTYYFDDEGQQQENSDNRTRYTAVVTVVDPNFPGVAATPQEGEATLERQLQTLQVELITAPSSDAVIRNTNSFAVTVANFGN